MTQQHDGFARAIMRNTHGHTKSQPDPRHDRLARTAEIDAIPRPEWTSTQMRELVHLLAQELGR